MYREATACDSAPQLVMTPPFLLVTDALLRRPRSLPGSVYECLPAEPGNTGVDLSPVGVVSISASKNLAADIEALPYWCASDVSTP